MEQHKVMACPKDIYLKISEGWNCYCVCIQRWMARVIEVLWTKFLGSQQRQTYSSRSTMEGLLKIGMLWLIGDAQGAISSTRGQQSQHVTRITFVTGFTLEQPESHLCNQKQTYATGVTYWWSHLWLESQICDWNCNMHLRLQYACEVSQPLCRRGANVTTKFITGYVTVISIIPHLVNLVVLWLLCNKGS
jgi:hypothetical protein